MYTLIDTETNRLEYEKFLKQFFDIENQNDKDENQINWLNLRRPHLNVMWVKSETIEEILPKIKSVKPKLKK